MSEITYLEAIREALFEEMERDENVFCLGEDIGAYGGAFKVTDGLMAKYGEQRVIDTPISEAAIIGAAAGAAHMGMRPVCEMQFIDFISTGYDMLTNYVATARYRAMLPCPMVVRGPSGGYVRGGPFHSQNPEAAFLHTPGLKIVYPATASDAKGLLKSAIRDEDCVLYFEHKYLYRRIKEEMPSGDHLTPIGKARIAREGKEFHHHLRGDRVEGARGGGAGTEGRRPLGRSHRPSDDFADGRRGDRRDGEEDKSGPDRA
jgi:pyruvate/2-oxoglutarate/acetoin dehydrogenase E1 component